jgi:hypothetical protein
MHEQGKRLPGKPGALRTANPPASPSPTPPPPQKKPLCPFPPCSKLGAVVFNRKPSGPELPSLLSPVLWLLLRVQALLCRRQPKTPDAPCTQEQAIAWLQHMLQAIDDFAQSAKNGTLPPLTPSAAPAPTTPSPHQDSQPAASAPSTQTPHHESPPAAPTPGASNRTPTRPAEKPTLHPTPPPIRANTPRPTPPPIPRRKPAPHRPTQAAPPRAPLQSFFSRNKITRVRPHTQPRPKRSASVTTVGWGALPHPTTLTLPTTSNPTPKQARLFFF